MTKMREAFIRLYGAELLSALSGSQFEAGYQAAIADVKAGGAVAFTAGHCKEKQKPGGCQLHNLQCGYPDCDRKLPEDE